VGDKSKAKDTFPGSTAGQAARLDDEALAIAGGSFFGENVQLRTQILNLLRQLEAAQVSPGMSGDVRRDANTISNALIGKTIVDDAGRIFPDVEHADGLRVWARALATIF